MTEKYSILLSVDYVPINIRTLFCFFHRSQQAIYSQPSSLMAVQRKEFLFMHKSEKKLLIPLLKIGIHEINRIFSVANQGRLREKIIVLLRIVSLVSIFLSSFYFMSIMKILLSSAVFFNDRSKRRVIGYLHIAYSLLYVPPIFVHSSVYNISAITFLISSTMFFRNSKRGEFFVLHKPERCLFLISLVKIGIPKIEN